MPEPPAHAPSWPRRVMSFSREKRADKTGGDRGPWAGIRRAEYAVRLMSCGVADPLEKGAASIFME